MSVSPLALRRVLLIIGTLLFIGLVALMFHGVRHSGDADRDTLPSTLIGKPAPRFDLPLLHAPEIRITPDTLAGAPYVLNVWGSWCPACRDEHPVLSRFALTKRVRVVGYDWKDTREDALRWLEQYGNPYLLVVTDEAGDGAIDWGVAAAPETFLVDGKGIIRWKHAGPLTDAIIERELLPELLKAERGQ